MMTSAGFLRRLEDGRSVNFPYKQGELVGLVSAWRHQDFFVLTWEECNVDDVNDERRYTRDERHTFPTSAEVLAFVAAHGLSARDFRP